MNCKTTQSILLEALITVRGKFVMLYFIGVITVILVENGVLLRDTLRSLRMYDSDKTIKSLLRTYNLILFIGNMILQSTIFVALNIIMKPQSFGLLTIIVIICMSLIIGYAISCFLANTYLSHMSKR